MLLAQREELPKDGPSGDKILADARLVDGWGQPIYYVTKTEGDYHLVSSGADRLLKTGDDIRSYPDHRTVSRKFEKRHRNTITLPAETRSNRNMPAELDDVAAPAENIDVETPAEEINVETPAEDIDVETPEAESDTKEDSVESSETEVQP